MDNTSIMFGIVGVMLLWNIIQFFINKSKMATLDNLTEEYKLQNSTLLQSLDAKNTENLSLNKFLNETQIELAKYQKEYEYSGEKLQKLSQEKELLLEQIQRMTDKDIAINETLSSLKIELAQRESTIASLQETSEANLSISAKREKELTQGIQELKTETTSLNQTITKLIEEKNGLIEERTRYLSERDAQRQKHEELTEAFEEQKKNLREEMHNTMQKLLEGKIEKFDEISIKGLEGILKPFRENIEGFKKKIEENQKESSEKLLSLAKEIEMVSKTGASISQEASNLAKALKGEKQAQGRWGEMVLESVLEHSGLIKGDHYHMQESYKDDDGKQKRTDVIIKLPEDKSIIIDSKVSLVDYDRYVGSETEEQRKISAIALAKAFKNQIDILSSKEYTQYDLGTLQYVFMFVPIESAYAVAVHQDPSLYEYALKKQIIIVYPSTLIVTLKTIYMYWQRDKADQKIETIYKNAGDLYDKVYAFVDTFEKVGRQIETLNGSFHDAQKHLYDGKGNIIKRAQDLKVLGAKTSKNLKSIRSKHLSISDDEIEVVLAEEENEIGLLEERSDVI